MLSHLCQGRLQCRPVEAGQKIDQHLWVQLELILHQFYIFGMEWIGSCCTLAGLDGAGHEIESKDLHGDGEDVRPGFCFS